MLAKKELELMVKFKKLNGCYEKDPQIIFDSRKFFEKLFQKMSVLLLRLTHWSLGGHYYTESLKKNNKLIGDFHYKKLRTN